MEDYLVKIPIAKRNDAGDPISREIARVVQGHKDKYNTEITLRQALVELAEDGAFNTNDPDTTAQKIGAFLAYVAVMKVEQQLKMQDWSAKSVGVSQTKLALFQAAYESFLEKCGYNRVVQEGDRAMLETGDFFSMFSGNEQFFEDGLGMPCTFRNISVGDLFFPTTAKYLYNPGNEYEVRKFVKSWRGPWELCIEKFPWMKDGTAGEVPVDEDNIQLDKLEQDEDKNRLVQVLELIDLDTDGGTSAYVGGASTLKGPVLKGEEFPYKDENGRNVNPLTHKYTFKKTDGILKRGVYHAVKNLAIIERKLKNAGYNYQLVNLNPVQVVVIPEGESKENMASQFAAARKAQAQTQQGVIFAEGGANSQVYNLKAEPLINELKACLDQVYMDFAIWGINLKDVLTDPAKTAYAIQVEGEGQTKLPRYIQNNNAIETERQLNMPIDWLRQHGEESWDMTLEVSVDVKDEEGIVQEVVGTPVIDEFGEEKVVPFTVGDMVAFVRNNDVVISVQQDSGYVNPRSYQRLLANQKIQRLLSFGLTPELVDALEEAESVEGRTLKLNSLRDQLNKPVKQPARAGAAQAEAPTAPEEEALAALTQ